MNDKKKFLVNSIEIRPDLAPPFMHPQDCECPNHGSVRPGPLIVSYDKSGLAGYPAIQIDPLLAAVVNFVDLELRDDPTQDDPACSLHDLIEALTNIGLPPITRRANSGHA